VFAGVLTAIGVLLLKKLYEKSIKHVIVMLIVGLMAVVYGLGPLHAKNKVISKDHFDFDGFFKGLKIENTTPIYAYKNTSPEMVWARGSKIPVIENLSDLKEGTTFYVIDNQVFEESIEKDENIRSFMFEAPYLIDLNYEGADHKNRKVGYVYKLITRE
jgi:hypothetical protein